MNLAGLVSECQQTLDRAGGRQGVELRLVAETGCRRVLADRGHLERVVQNLLGNAVKFSHPGGRVDGPARRRTTRRPAQRDRPGIGIPAEEQEQVFARFFRSSLSVADEIQGAGLGLALVQTVVEWHGGTVEVDSSRARGPPSPCGCLALDLSRCYAGARHDARSLLLRCRSEV